MSDSRDAPLSGLRVAITRPENQIAELESLLVQQGAEVLRTPLIAIRFTEPDVWSIDCSGPEATDKPVYDWTVFTSVNAVAAFYNREWREEHHDLDDRSHRISSGHNLTRSGYVAAIGTATATALRKFDVDADLIPDQFVTDSLIAAIKERLGRDLKGMRFLLPRGDLAKPDLPAALRAHGAIVDELVVYKTVAGAGVVPLWEMIANAQVDILTFASSSAVRCFVEGADSLEMLFREGRPKIFVIGPITRDTAYSYNLPVDGMATQYDSAGLVNCIIETIDRTLKNV